MTRILVLLVSAFVVSVAHAPRDARAETSRMEATNDVLVTPLYACDNGAEIIPSELASWADDQSSIDDDEDPDDKRLCRAGYEAVLPAPPTGRCSAAWARDRLYELGCFRPPI